MTSSNNGIHGFELLVADLEVDAGATISANGKFVSNADYNGISHRL